MIDVAFSANCAVSYELFYGRRLQQVCRVTYAKLCDTLVTHIPPARPSLLHSLSQSPADDGFRDARSRISAVSVSSSELRAWHKWIQRKLKQTQAEAEPETEAETVMQINKKLSLQSSQTQAHTHTLTLATKVQNLFFAHFAHSAWIKIKNREGKPN